MKDFTFVHFILYLVFFICSLQARGSSEQSNISAAEAWIEANQQAILRDTTELLSIPTVSSQSEHKEDVRRGAEWIFNKLKRIGLENVQLMETGGHPAVYADWLHAGASAPTVLIYGHFDVQPADPFDLWTTGPFNPTVRADNLYARGASDDKGPVVCVIAALEALLATSGQLPVHVKLLLEGEEEIGSRGMIKFVEKNKALLKSDYAISADGAQVTSTQPGICLGLRGLVGLEITAKGANRDLHSGAFGGAVANPLHALVKVLDNLRDKDTGRVLVDGFYDDVDEIGEMEKRDVEAFSKAVPPEVGLKAIGVETPFGEKGFSVYEQLWLRPTLEIVGIIGGYTEEGLKTVLPNTATAKISCRIVTSQRAQDVYNKVTSFIGKMSTPGVHVETRMLEALSDPVRVQRSGVAVEAAKTVLTQLYNKIPLMFMLGGSIPVVELLQRHIGIDAVLFAPSSLENNAHSPNEFLSLADLKKTQKGYVQLLHEISNEHRKTVEKDSTKDEL